MRQGSARPVIETHRLRLRELQRTDGDRLASMYADPDVMRFIGKGGVLTAADAARSIERQIESYRTRGFGEWATELRESGELVGVCGLIVWPDIDGREELEVAYMFARPAWGRGLGTEVARAIRDWAASELERHRLVSCIYHANAASIRVAEKIGMRYEKDFEYHGRPMALYAWSAATPA
jgi:RimJ/RimL family protein N-acetyltransferase